MQKNVETCVFCFFMVLFSSFLCNFAADLKILTHYQKDGNGAALFFGVV